MKRLLLFLCLVSSGFAQEGLPRVRNYLSQQGRVPNSLPTNGATAGQFESAAITSGGHVSQATGGSNVVTAPTANSSYRLHRSIAGASFATGVPDYAFGDEILPPPLVPGVTAWRAEPVRPGESIPVLASNSESQGTWSQDSQTFVPANTPVRYHYSRHAKKVFASAPGQAEIFWRSEFANANGYFTVVRRTPLVSIVSLTPPRRVFWTEQPEVPLNSIPFVNLGDVSVEIAFRSDFPATSGSGQENRTLWQDTLNKSLHAQLITGRVFMEILGAVVEEGTNTRVHLGTAVVDVLRAPVRNTTEFTVTTNLGEPLLPSDGNDSLLAEPKSATALNFIRFQVSRQRYYAERETEAPNDVVIFWTEVDQMGITWPYMRNLYNLVWPEDPAAYALNALRGDSTATPVNLFTTNNPELVHQDADGEASYSNGEFTVAPGADQKNRALLRFGSPREGAFWYLRVYSATHERFTEVNGQPTFDGRTMRNMVAYSANVFVGNRISPPPLPPSDGGFLSRAGYILPSGGTAYHTGAYLNPLANTISAFSEAEAQSEIIPVNALASNNQLKVSWFRKVSPPDPSFQALYWPSIVATYNLEWRAINPDPESEIVVARNNGTGDLPPEQAAGYLYFQNDPATAGYNPNEEHALMLGGRAYALRVDLNSTSSSEPRVLLSYIHADGRPAMRDFAVVRERAPYFFQYPALAGTLLQAPKPLPFLPTPVDVNGVNSNSEIANAEPDQGNQTPSHYDKFTFEDRKHQFWVYRGPHGLGSPSFQVRYFYKTLPSFAFPGIANQPEPGSIEPFLKLGQEPQAVTFSPAWPSNVPVLQFGQTLAKAQFGLPAVRGQTSMQVIYEQSRAQVAAGDIASVNLFDPTRAKRFFLGGNLSALPFSIATDSRNGKTYFQNLPPHLKERFYFDPLERSAGALVLQGRFVDDVVGDDYFLLNTLGEQDLQSIESLAADNDSARQDWLNAVHNLSTTVETFGESSQVPGTYIPQSSVSYSGDELALITHPDQAVDSYALAAVGQGTGYVTLAAGNGLAFTPEDEPVSFHIIKVDAPMNKGQLKVLTSSNPLDEKVSLRHSSDFAARTQDYEFQWRYSPPINGQAPALSPLNDNPGGNWIPPGTGMTNSHVLQGAGVQTLADNYWVMRYRPSSATHPARANSAPGWSEWTDPALVEGYIKRALAGINPFNQRVSDFFNNAVNTDVSILSQAGARWEGDIALNLANINEFGLIEIYETILNRGINLSINGTPPLDYGPANDALLLAAGYLSDLYSIIGDEAAADAANPTIAFDAQSIGSVADSTIAVDFSSLYQQTSTARFAFQGQVSNLLEEELHLLRGRDDRNSPGVELSPAYNRLFWNYTRGINAGEVIYALNYNIRERQAESADGKIDAADAQRMFPQGHGDAYGHYLTALKGYYRLLSDPQFTWTPRIEAVNVLGVPVQVDYLDERKFASAAAHLAKTAKQVIGLVHRQAFRSDKSQGWRHFRDGSDPAVNYRDGKATSSKRTRHWGLDEWAARGGQGAYFHWLTANSILPANDTIHTGIQKIDRHTVVELSELALTSEEIQTAVDKANAWLNPLGLAAESTLFDINPTELAAGKTHFEQIYQRAKVALGNAFDTFDQATASTRLLRSLENQADDLSSAVFDQERAFNLELIEIFGTPYSGDMGPGKAYVQGYSGPDLLRYFYINKVTEFSDPFDVTGNTDIGGGPGGDGTVQFTLRVASYAPNQYANEFTEENAEALLDDPPYGVDINYVIRPDRPVQYATEEMGQRAHPGQLQVALQDLNARREDMAAILDFYNRNNAIFETNLAIFREALEGYQARQDLSSDAREKILGFLGGIAALNSVARGLDVASEIIQAVADATIESLPAVNGVANDFTFPARGGTKFTILASLTTLAVSRAAAESAAEFLGLGVADVENDLDRQLEEAGFPEEYRRMGAEVQASYYDWLALGSNVDQAAFSLEQSRLAYAATLAKGQNILSQREIFRKRAAAIIQGYRTRDVAFRTFRSEALEQYQTLLDWSTRYAWLAAKAYDYETGLLGTSQGQSFLNSIVATRALGLRNSQGEPIFGASGTGDPGVSGLLAKLSGDWSSVKTRLGFNNPDTSGTLFSLRSELYRIPEDTVQTSDTDPDKNNDSQNDKTWKERLQSMIVRDLRSDSDVAKHCLSIANLETPEPGFVIPFSSTVQDGFNFFGLPLAGRDHNFTSTSFATKIHSVGLAFIGYVGQDPFPLALNAPSDLSATPYVYFIPTGQDIMRTPPLGNPSITRTYDVQDYALPLPYNIGANEFSDVDFWTGNSSLTESFLVPRKHQAFRAVADTRYFFSPLAADYTNRRLVGRSVWNTGWKIVIPGKNLLNDPTEGMNRFLRTVTDIKLFIRGYSYSGN